MKKIILYAFVSVIFAFGGAIISSCSSNDLKGGTEIILEVESTGDRDLDKRNIEDVVHIVTLRLVSSGIENGRVKKGRAMQVAVSLPPDVETGRIEDLISRKGRLDFRIVEASLDTEGAVQGSLPPGTEVLFNGAKDKPYVTRKEGFPAGRHVAEARVDVGGTKRGMLLSVLLDDEGKKLFGDFTEENLKRKVAMVFDDTVLSAPVIQERITGGRIVVVDRLTIAEARDLATALNSGAYPLPVSVVASRPL